MIWVFLERWTFQACHGRFVGNPRSSSSSGSSATMPWGSTSPLPSSRWTSGWLESIDCSDDYRKHSDVAVARLLSDILGIWGSRLGPVCFLLWLCRLPGFLCQLLTKEWINFKQRCPGVGWPRCTEQKRFLDTGLAAHENIYCNWTFSSMLMTSLLGLLTPLAAYTSIWAIFALRVAQVIVIGFFYFLISVEIIVVVISRVFSRESPTLHWTHTYHGGLPFKREPGANDC